MTSTFAGYRKILVAVDFSEFSQAALQQAVWLARQNKAKVVLVHATGDLRKTVHSLSVAAKVDLLRGEGELFEREVRQTADVKMRGMIRSLKADDLEITSETIVGEPFVELIHAVQQEGHDLVVAGTRGLSNFHQFMLGSTAKRLIRKCPVPVLVTRPLSAGIPRVILAPVDFSDISRKALEQAAWIAKKANAILHVLHVVHSTAMPQDLLDRASNAISIQAAVTDGAQQQLDSFTQFLEMPANNLRTEVVWGTPWKEICRIAKERNANLVAMGTVGRSGIPGLLLGSTAESVLLSCECNVLTAKADDFVSPIRPADWPLHP